MTVPTVHKFNAVKMLFKNVDSFTPMISNPVRTMTNAKDMKSGNGDMKSMLMGIRRVSFSCITLPTKASM